MLVKENERLTMADPYFKHQPKPSRIKVIAHQHKLGPMKSHHDRAILWRPVTSSNAFGFIPVVPNLGRQERGDEKGTECTPSLGY